MNPKTLCTLSCRRLGRFKIQIFPTNRSGHSLTESLLYRCGAWRNAEKSSNPPPSTAPRCPPHAAVCRCTIAARWQQHHRLPPYAGTASSAAPPVSAVVPWRNCRAMAATPSSAAVRRNATGRRAAGRRRSTAAQLPHDGKTCLYL